jgi:hypothetical protein
MRTPNPSPLGLPTRCKAFDNPPSITEVQHWSYDPARKLRAKAFRVSARLQKLRALFA